MRATPALLNCFDLGAAVCPSRHSPPQGMAQEYNAKMNLMHMLKAARESFASWWRPASKVRPSGNLKRKDSETGNGYRRSNLRG